YFMKGPECDAEIAAAQQSHASVFRRAADHHYQIPETPHRRRLVVYERLAREVIPALPCKAGPAGAEGRAYCGAGRDAASHANPLLKLGRSLLGGPGIRKHGRAILAGPRTVADVLAQAPGRVEAWLTGIDGPPPPRPDLLWYRLADDLFRVLDMSGTHSPLVMVEVPAISAWSDEDPWPEGCPLFFPFRAPESVGAVIRSAAAFEAAQVVLLREAAPPFHPKSSRAAGPAVFQVSLRLGPSIHELEARG